MKNNRAKSFVTIMIVIAIVSLSLRFSIDRIIKISNSQNESNAQGTLKLISAALENYAKDNQNAYPQSLSALTEPKPPYLDKDYILQSPIKGYSYSCSRLEPSGYNCSAIPTRCKLTGKNIFTVTTGGLLVSEECEKKGEG
jgi:type II secretory pathway pseudopilin PulG